MESNDLHDSSYYYNLYSTNDKALEEYSLTQHIFPSPPSTSSNNSSGSSDMSSSVMSPIAMNHVTTEMYPNDEISISPSSTPEIKPLDNPSSELYNANITFDYQQLPNNICPTTCSVCGDKATGYHYEVPSCNGCKTFFRRTVLAKKQYHCLKGGKCFDVPPKEKRCTCKACRFQKCVNVGMNPLAIQQPENSKNVEYLNEITRKRKPIKEDGEQSMKMIPVPLISIETQTERLISQLMYLEIKTEQFRCCRFNPHPTEIPNLQEMVSRQSTLHLADKLGPMPNWPLPDEPLPYPPPEGICFLNPLRKNWLIYDIITTIEYAKTFPFFHQLSESDRISLMRAVVLLCFNISQAFYSYSKKSDILVHPDGTTLNAKIKLCKNNPVASHIGYIAKSKRETIGMLIRKEYTKVEYVLLKNIILCNTAADLSPEGCRLLSFERDKANKALFNHCMVAFGSMGPSRFADNLSMIDALERHSKYMKDIHVTMGLVQKNAMIRKIRLMEDIMT